MSTQLLFDRRFLCASLLLILVNAGCGAANPGGKDDDVGTVPSTSDALSAPSAQPQIFGTAARPGLPGPGFTVSNTQPPARGVANAFAASVSYAIPVGTTTHFSLQVAPNGACSLRGEGDASPAADVGLELFADDEGFVTFDAQPSSPGSSVSHIDCRTDDGTVSSYSLAVNAKAGVAAPKFPSHSSALPAGSFIQPALSGDPSQYTDQELRAQGYPPRPDPSAQSEAYANWLRRVSMPSTVIAPRLVERAGLWATNLHSPNWSGVTAFSPSAPFNVVSGIGQVPSVTLPTGFTWSTSVFWVGLDGDNTTDLIQDGTQQTAYSTGGVSYSSYSAWIEYVPNFLVTVSMTVHAGDSVSETAWVGDVSGNISMTGGFGWYDLYNSTTRASVETSIQKPSGAASYTGATAEWIMERPLVGSPQSLAILANYNAAEMDALYVGQVGVSGINQIGSAPGLTSQNTEMLNSSNVTISEGFRMGTDSAGFEWWAPN